MSLIGRLAEKSWLTPGVDGHRDPALYRPATATVAVSLYVGVATVIFALIISVYLLRMGLPGGMQHGTGDDWRTMPEPPLLWVNTVLLLVSSLAWEGARRAAGLGALKRMRLLASAGGALGLLFLAGQLLLWRQYQAAGYGLAANPANAFFYLLTALHGAHLAGGLVAAARALGQVGPNIGVDRMTRNVRLCAVYWHYLLLLWLVLAGLLVLT